jgi:hypothetical protein
MLAKHIIMSLFWLGGFGNFFVGDAAAAQLGFAVYREHHQPNLALTVIGNGLGNGRAAAVAKVLVGGAVVFLAIVVKRIPAAHFGVGVDVDGNKVLMVHGCLRGKSG